MNFPLFPLWFTELAGSALMIVFSFLCISLAGKLRKKDPENVVWTYLLWLSYSLAGFAISRSAGHIMKRLFESAGYDAVWKTLKPYSGSINTMSFFVVASITLFFERTWQIYQQISKDKIALQKTHEELVFLNRNLENLVADRTLELRLSEQKYRRIFEVSQDLMAVVLPDSRILDLNPVGKQMLGITGNEARPPAFFDFFETERDWKDLIETLQRAGLTTDVETQLKRLDGTVFSVIMNTVVEKEPDGKIAEIHIMAKDISQRKVMEQQLLLADKLASIGQLAAGIAHEINNPLSIILGYTQLLLRNEQEGTQNYSDYKKIEKSTRTCKTIVGDLLSFSRSTPGRKGVGHIHDAVSEVLSVLQHHFELDNVEIARHFDPSLPRMVMDDGRMKQVFMNLLMNAKQAIGKKGQIAIHTQYDPEAGKIFIQVRDTGCGIDHESLPRIFDPFFTTKPTGEGTGLGLSVSYGIVKDHGGEIFVESDPGKGSIFTIVLPVIFEEARQC
jgi:two-component system, NtrC family, sensor kinase